MKQNFNKYVNDKLAEWNQTANRDIKDAFSQLAISASQYGAAYGNVTDAISGKLGASINFSTTDNPEDRYPGWARFATGTVAFLLGDYAGAVGAGFGTLNWKGLLINIASVFGVNALLSGAFGVILGPLGILAVTTITGGAQMEVVRRKFVQATRDEMKKISPNVATEQSKVVYQEVNKVFDNYGSEVLKRISEIKYGDVLSTSIQTSDGEKIHERGTDLLQSFAILDSDRRMRSDIVSVEVFCPHPLLKQGIELIDLPGTDDMEAQNDLVYQQLLTVDLVVQVLDAPKLFTLGEVSKLKQWLINRGIETSIFVLNFMNLLDLEDRQAVLNRALSIAGEFRGDFGKLGILNKFWGVTKAQ